MHSQIFYFLCSRIRKYNISYKKFIFFLLLIFFIECLFLIRNSLFFFFFNRTLNKQINTSVKTTTLFMESQRDSRRKQIPASQNASDCVWGYSWAISRFIELFRTDSEIPNTNCIFIGFSSIELQLCRNLRALIMFKAKIFFLNHIIAQ